jgi:DNA-binding NarL/FixJ family response regulator
VIFFESNPRLLTSAVHLLKGRWPQARTLLVGLANQEDSIIGSVAAGADGIVLDEESFEELEQAIPAVRAGSFRPPPKLVRPLFDRLVWLEGRSRKVGNDPRLARLTTREREILAHVAPGEANKQIAAELHVEEQTIKNHLQRMFRKLNVHTRADAARVWLQSAARRHEPDRGA